MGGTDNKKLNQTSISESETITNSRQWLVCDNEKKKKKKKIDILSFDVQGWTEFYFWFFYDLHII